MAVSPAPRSPREQRDWETNLTALSGDIGVADDSSDNSYHVVVALYGVDATAILDGFTIRGGNANGEINDAYGGGLFNHTSSPSVSNVIFTANSAMLGGGMGSMIVSSPTLTNVTFSANTANYGGGMYSSGGSTILTGVTFSGNSAQYNGGGMNIYQTNNPTLTNVIFSGNSAEDSGGGMFNDSYSLTLTNGIFNNNSAATGGGLYNEFSAAILTNVTFSGNYASLNGGGMFNITSSTPTLNNTIVWGNLPFENQVYDSATSVPIVHYSNIQGGCPSYAICDHVTNLDPQFVRLPSPGADGTWGTSDDDTGDLHLQLTSPAIDAGDNSAVPVGIITDLLGASRFVDILSVPDTGVGTPPIVDLGAYEAQKFITVYLSFLMK